jgi:arabinofuranan 3-O-arabinosyltransferase
MRRLRARLLCRCVPARIRNRAVPLALAALAFALALLQRPGWSSSDTKIDLHTDPIRFLGEITSLWTPSSGLGGVESAQYAGYLFPMGPFFALGHALGLGAWLVDRLWLGLLLAVGCWGMVRLAEALGAVRMPVGAATAGLVYLLNPYVVVFANRTSVTLLAYALLPWLVLVAWRGLREPDGWRLPALFALLVTASGGGVNAAVVALALLGPLAIVLYEPLVRTVPWRAAWRFGWRALVATAAASLWWAAPAAAQAAYGVDFLRFTEPAGAIWATTSLSESFRSMGYWISYIGVGFNGVVRPYFTDAGTLLFEHVVVTATLVVPGLALLGFAWTRRRRYAAWFLALVLLGTLLMAIGFPEGTPLRRGATFAYNHFPSVRFLRTTYKAGPLVVLGVAGLAAMAIEAAFARIGARRIVLALAAGAVLAASAWPLVTGDAVDPQVTWKQIPSGWQRAAADLDRTLGDDERAAVLPGQLYAFYRWGGTVDPILPSLTKKPVAVRNAVPYGDLRGTDLLWTADALLQQGRLLPGQLPPLLELMSVGRVVAATDDDVNRSGIVDPSASVAALAAQGLSPRERYSPGVRSFGVERPRPLVRVEPRMPTTVVDGSAAGLAALAADGALPARDPIAFAGDLSADTIRSVAHDGGRIAISDSNRRRVFVVSRMQQNAGATLAAGDVISEDAATLDPFADRGSDGQTVAVFHGARTVSAPFSPGYSQFPEHRPFAAVDGNPRTAWFGDRALDPDRHVLTIAFTQSRNVDRISVLPRNEAGARTIAVVVNGRRFVVGRGWTQLDLGLKQVIELRLRVIGAKTGSASGAGLAEVRVPRLHVTESLRPPLLAERALRGVDVSRATLDYSFTRASGDNPWKRPDSAGVRVTRRVSDPSELEQLRVDGAGDEEVGIDRVISPPAAREYDVNAWLSVLPEAPDSAIDRLVGTAGPVVADSSARFEGRPGYRASSALDGDPATAWTAPYPGLRGVTPVPWVRVVARERFELRRIGIEPPLQARVARPTRVRVKWPGGSEDADVVAGRIRLGRPVRTRRFELIVLKAEPADAKAVGIGELRVPGLPAMHPRRSGPIRGCRAAMVLGGDAPVGLRVDGDIRDLDASRPLRASGCGRLRVGAGQRRVRIPAATLRPDSVLLSSPAPSPIARTSPTAGSVRDPGDPGRGRRDHVKLDVTAPAWLVLGESFDRGWRAWCGDKSLGRPVPLDGYANAWRVEPGCNTARFAFAPQRPVHAIQLLSALACLVLLAIALGAGRRTRHRAGADARVAAGARAADARADWPDSAPERMALRRAAIAGLVAGGILAFCFSLRSGVLIAPAVALVLWRAIPAVPLAVAGGLLLAVAVPLDYIVFPAPDFGGYNPGYAGDHVSGHWIAVAAWVLLALALWQTISTASGRRGGPSGAPGDAAE